MDYNIVEVKPMAENTREELDRYLADICSVVRDKNVKNPHSLTDRLLKESYGGKSSSVLAFVPCIVKKDIVKPFSRQNRFMQTFGFIDLETQLFHTNLREVLNLGIELDEALQYVDFTHYKAFKARVPNFTYSQLRTHTQVNFLQQSNRYVATDYGYFMPDEVSDYFWSLPAKQRSRNGGLKAWWNTKVKNTSPAKLIDFMRRVGVKRKEIYNRGADSLKIRPCSIGFNLLNPNSWQHFKNQRMNDSHTQLECRIFMKELAKKVLK